MSRANFMDSKKRHHALNVKSSADKPQFILQINWKCPPKFALKKEWCVAAGEESECVGGRMPPPRPSVSSDVEGEYYDDNHIPKIPIFPIEEAAEAQLNGLTPVNYCPVSQPPPMLKDQSTSETPHCNLPVPLPNEKAVVDLIHGLKDGDLVSAATAAAAVASILRSKEHGRSVDPNLLIELLRDPKMMWKLVDKNELGAEVKTRPIAGPEPIASFPLPSSTEDGEPSSRKTPAISKRVTEKELIPMPSTKPRTRSQTVGACGKTHSGILPIAAPKPVKQATPFWRSNSGTSLTKNLIFEPGSSPRSRISKIGGIRTVSFPIPSSSKTNMEMIKRMINEYGAQEVKPDAPRIPSTSKPNEVIEKIVNKYRGLDNSATLNSHMVANPGASMDSATLNSHMVANPDASMDSVQQTKAISGSGRYHFPSVTMGHSAPLLKDSDYCKSLVKQYGETQVNEKHEVSKIGQPGKCLHGLEFPRNIKFELDLNNQLPSMYLNGQGGDRVRPGRVVETSVAKRMKLG
ncbi:zinc finger CCCH domain-containing protein 45-like isoform X2 [Olea europaea var. sylvestris]|uniref:zinc finger CCCH domain-containing protein 45-like isoform X2 n=1 Tax=Olea europaea var. sylvestris TaxID=158386 RepID=UPI000C1D7284|nr:zinc finger CCCH domain-containing protein 45-like isoform X2 [Olea europaea var. sylvestris]